MLSVSQCLKYHKKWRHLRWSEADGFQWIVSHVTALVFYTRELGVHTLLDVLIPLCDSGGLLFRRMISQENVIMLSSLPIRCSCRIMGRFIYHQSHLATTHFIRREWSHFGGGGGGGGSINMFFFLRISALARGSWLFSCTGQGYMGMTRTLTQIYRVTHVCVTKHHCFS